MGTVWTHFTLHYPKRSYFHQFCYHCRYSSCSTPVPTLLRAIATFPLFLLAINRDFYIYGQSFRPSYPLLSQTIAFLSSPWHLLLQYLQYICTNPGWNIESEAIATNLTSNCGERRSQFFEGANWYNNETAIAPNFLSSSDYETESLPP